MMKEKDQSRDVRTLEDTIGMSCWRAMELGLDWSSHWPVMDELTLHIVGLLDKSADASDYFFVGVPDPWRWTMNGNDAAIRKKSPANVRWSRSEKVAATRSSGQ